MSYANSMVDPKWNFNYWFEEAIKNIPSDAAYYTVKNGTPVSELMNEAAAKIEKLKINPSVKSLAARWQEKLGATAKPE